VFEDGKAYANEVAAMPSLHAAFAMLLALYLWRLVPRYTRPLLALYPPAMTLALVYAGEHYVVDCIAGWLYAVFAFVSVNRYFAWRESRAPGLEPAFGD
jgi:membrane-associated phospholipid phosphatase